MPEVAAYWAGPETPPGYDPADIADTLGWPYNPAPVKRPVTVLPDISTWQETTHA